MQNTILIGLEGFKDCFFPEGLTGFSMNLGDWIRILFEFEGNVSSKFSFVGQTWVQSSIRQDFEVY